ncbi:uncharacterized protein JCM6883_003459 [Sporobolomyces salmoneus]|uniref:uncharacterized protein n=1 Tax=Sporobolomyces salmoneus TaxID=183962 RepID=UPI00317D3A6C
MSTNSTALDGLPQGFSLTGGIPTMAQDFAASIIFTIAYALVIPLLTLRICRKSSRTLVLIRPAIFISLRIATFVVRAMQADGNESEGLFVAEQIFLLCGFLLLLEPFATLVKYNIYRDWIPEGRKDNLSRLLLLVHLAVYTAIGLGIYTGSSTSKATTDPDLAETLKHCRWASAGIALAVVLVSLALAIYAQITGVSDLRRTGYLGALGTFLLIPSVYRLVLYGDPSHPFSASGKAVFYILFVLPEYLAVLMCLSINLQTTFDIKEGSAKEKWNRKAKKGKVTGTYSSPYDSSPFESHEMIAKEQA